MKDLITNLIKKHYEILSYIFFGVLTTVVSLVSYKIFRIIGFHYQIATVLSWIFAVTFAYITNKLFVFHSKNLTLKENIKECIDFFGCRILSLILEFICMFILVDLVKIDDFIAKVVVQFVVVVANYVLSKLIVFNKKKLKNEENKIQSKHNFLFNTVIYSIIFLGLFILIYSTFIKYDASFFWKDDGYTQHYPILYQFNQFFRNILNDSATFTWNVGLGEDIIGQYSYYVLGDPFAYISLLFPMDKLELAYNFLIVLRMYCVGLSFLIFCNYMKKESYNSILGAIIYTFSGFVLVAAMRHPYFTNPVILLPLLLIGIEKLFNENKKGFLTIMLFISLVVNYYFFYMLTILILIYALIKYIFEYKNEGIKFLLKKIIQGLICFFIAILMASFIFLPTVYAYLNSIRLGEPNFYLFSKAWYQKLATGLISTECEYWNVYGVSSIVLLMLPLLIKNIKTHKKTFTFLVVTFTMTLIPFFGSMMNGFSFANNRWIFVISFILAYVTVLFIRKDLNYTKDEIKYMIIGVFAYIAILVLLKCQISLYLVRSIFYAILIIAIIYYKDKINKLIKFKIAPYIVFILVILNITNVGNSLYELDGKGYVKEFYAYTEAIQKYNDLSDNIINFGESVEYLKQDNSFNRIGYYPTLWANFNLALDFKSNTMFLSIGNKYECLLGLELENPNFNVSNCLNNMNNRTKITTLLGTKYYITNEENTGQIPYGYKLKKIIQNEKALNTYIYENKNYLPIGIFYDSYITSSEYNKLDALEKEQSLMETAAVDKNDIKEFNISSNKNTFKQNKVNYKLKDNDNIINGNNIYTEVDKKEIKLKISKIQNSELYVYIKNLKFEPYNATEFKKAYYRGDSKIEEGYYNIEYKNYIPSYSYSISAEYNNFTITESTLDKKTSAYYYENKDIVLNLGYQKNNSGNIILKFNGIGKYTFDSIEIVAVPMDKYIEDIKKLKNNVFNITEYTKNTITGTISNNKPGILRIATGYTKGWDVYVDEKKEKVVPINGYFIGVPLNSGNHNITFKYRTPYLKEGTLLSIIGIILFIIMLVIENKLDNKKKKNYN